MEEKDYSKEIYEKFFSSEGRILTIFLKDGSVAEGILVGFFRGDVEAGEPYIIKWHFIPEPDIEKYHSIALAEIKNEFGRLIRQEEINRVQFKEKR